VVVERDTGRRRSLYQLVTAQFGAISPDGNTAVLASDQGRTVQLLILDLQTGTQLLATQDFDPFPGGQAFVWAPDSSRVFTIGGTGALAVVDPRTGAASDLGVALPPLHQLAVRPAP
jgi:hypothetical protein